MNTMTATPVASATAVAGGKAAGLAALIAAGLPVPPGIVLDAAAGSPAELAAAAVGFATAHRWEAVAVRSSGRDEDGAETAAAGAYATVLNVPGDDAAALTEAIGTVVRSMGEDAAGVIVQRMVPADAAGVAFTVDPVTGDRTVVVNAVAGLGDALVSGLVTPTEVRIARGDDDAVTIPPAAEGPLEREVLAELVRFALAAEAARGGPQDVEWAVVNGAVWLLQSRPVTALAEQIPIEVVVPPGFWMRDPTHGRLPRTRMTSSVLDENRATRRMVDECGMLATFSAVVIGGWHYVTIVPVGAPPPAPGKTPPMLPGWLVSLLIRASSAGRRQLRTARALMKSDGPARLLAEWEERYRNEQQATILAFQDVDLGGLDDAALAAQLRARGEFMRDSAELHFRMHTPYGLGLNDLAVFCRTKLGWTPEQTWELLSGLASVASDPGRALAEIVQLDAASPERADAMERFLTFYGCRSLDLEVAEPTLAESPHLLGALLEAAARADGVDATEEVARVRAAAAERARDALSPRDIAEFGRVLGIAERVYGLRDDNVFLCADAPLALVRYAALEVGRRLAARGMLDHPDDVFHLTDQEAAAALESPHPRADVLEVARRSRGERAWAIAHPGPLSYGEDPGPPPEFTLLTRAERAPTESLMAMGELIMPSTDVEAGVDGVLRGTPASPGRVTGPARIVHAEADFHKLRSGDIVVCPGTRPSWSVIFPMIGGLVADAGGSLSHPAIIAREYGIPAVVAAVGATELLHDGDLVTIDGIAGTVTRL